MKCDDCDDGWLRDIKADGWIQCPKCRGLASDDAAAIARRDETLRRQANAAPMARQPDDPGPTEIPQRMFDEHTEEKPMPELPDLIGRYVIVRTYSAGVHAGVLLARNGGEVSLTNARRLWYWRTADKGISLSDVAVGGINPAKSKVCAALDRIDLLGAIEIIPTTGKSQESIESANAYRA